MKKLIFLFLLIFSGSLCAQSVEEVSLEQLLQKFDQRSDEITVYNFWATWCRPCVAELPYFEEAGVKLKGQGVNMVLVTMDFSENKESKVIPFLKKRGITSEVILFDEEKPNSWIDKIHPDWGGAIPITLIIDERNGTKHFFDRTFESTNEVLKLIQSIKSQKQ